MDVKKYAAEAIGTFWLTFAGCGSAVIAAAFPQVGIGLLGVSLAFGLSVVTMAYAIGHVSGCHLNPAVTVGLAAGGRFPAGQIVPYVIAQVIGAVAAAALLYVIASGAAGFDVAKGFASNGYGAHSPGQYSLVACFIMEVVMTMMFLFIIMGATHGNAPAGFAPLAIGLDAGDDPSGQHSRDQHVGQSGAQHRTGVVRRRLGAGAALAVLAGALDRRRAGWRDLSLAEPGAGRRCRGAHPGLTRRRYFSRGDTCVTCPILRPGPRRALAVEVDGGAGDGQPSLVVVDIVPDQVGHGDRAVADRLAERPAGDGADVLLELRDRRAVQRPVSGIVHARARSR